MLWISNKDRLIIRIWHEDETKLSCIFCKKKLKDNRWNFHKKCLAKH